MVSQQNPETGTKGEGGGRKEQVVGSLGGFLEINSAFAINTIETIFDSVARPRAWPPYRWYFRSFRDLRQPRGRGESPRPRNSGQTQSEGDEMDEESNWSRANEREVSRMVATSHPLLPTQPQKRVVMQRSGKPQSGCGLLRQSGAGSSRGDISALYSLMQGALEQ